MSQHLYQDGAHSFEDLIAQSLARTGFVDAVNLRIEVPEGRVVLRGIVGSYYQKQLAQESIRSVVGARKIQNDLEVVFA